MYAESELIQLRWTCLEFDVRYAVGKFVGAGSYFWKGGSQNGGSEEPPPLVTGPTKVQITSSGMSTLHVLNRTGGGYVCAVRITTGQI